MSADCTDYVPSDPDEWQQARALRCFTRFAPVLLLGTLLGCAAIVLYLWPVTRGSLLVICFNSGLALCAALWLAWHAQGRRHTGAVAHDFSLVRRWLRLSSLAIGAFWAVTSLALLPADSPLHQGLVAFILAAVTALWLPLFALDRVTLVTLAAPVLLPMAFSLLSSPTAGPSTTMGSTLLLLFAAIVAAARSLERMLEADSASQRTLYHKATHDCLVGLINHAEFDRYVNSLETRRPGACAVVFVDLDHFKQVNDTAGHAAGDRALQEVAMILREQKRKADVAARVGGDEFAILMELCSDHEAMRVAEAVLTRVNELELHSGAQRLRVTASIGIACANSDRVSVSSVLEAADRACYAAKRAGRNRIVLATQTEPGDGVDANVTPLAALRLVRPSCGRNDRPEGYAGGDVRGIQLRVAELRMAREPCGR